MAAKQVVRAFKLQGFSLHPDALQRLVTELTKCVELVRMSDRVVVSHEVRFPM
jgi:hypothetical protein